MVTTAMWCLSCVAEARSGSRPACGGRLGSECSSFSVAAAGGAGCPDAHARSDPAGAGTEDRRPRVVEPTGSPGDWRGSSRSVCVRSRSPEQRGPLGPCVVDPAGRRESDRVPAGRPAAVHRTPVRGRPSTGRAACPRRPTRRGMHRARSTTCILRPRPGPASRSCWRSRAASLVAARGRTPSARTDPGRRVAAAARPRRWCAGFDPPARPLGRRPPRRRPARRARVSGCAPRWPGGWPSPASLAGRGVVVVDHGDTRTTYEPVAAAVAGRRARSRPASASAAWSWSGRTASRAACLHWGWLRGDDLPRPAAAWSARRPVRLLPLSGAHPSGRRPHWRGSRPAGRVGSGAGWACW